MKKNQIIKTIEKITRRNENIRHNITRIILAITFVTTPIMAMAQANTTTTGSSLSPTNTLSDLTTKAVGYFNQAIYLIIALSIVVFVWNIYKYFIVSDPENKKDAGKYVLYSVTGLFVILSFWGLVNIISNTLHLNTTAGAINIQALTGSSGTTNGAFNPAGSGVTTTQ